MGSGSGAGGLVQAGALHGRPLKRVRKDRHPNWYLAPEDHLALGRCMRFHGMRENLIMSYRRTMWLLAWYYLNGMRRFDVFDPATGSVLPFYLDQEGNLEYQSQKLLSEIDRASAKIASMDLRLKVERQGMNLRLMRERASAQVIGDALVNHDQVRMKTAEFANVFCPLGFAGVAGHIKTTPAGVRADVEVVHPRELLPFPAIGQDVTKRRGLMRQRLVPLEWLRQEFGANVPTEDLESWRIRSGDPIEDPRTEPYRVRYTDQNPYGTGTKGRGSEDDVEVVRIRELWIDGDAGMCCRYVIQSGDWIGDDVDLSGAEKYCPVGIGNFLPTGTFHGVGMFDLLFPIAREQERLLKSLFNNMRDSDRYGILVLPHGSFNERALLREQGNGLRVAGYSPDSLGGDFKPFVIEPHNLGDVPGRTAQFTNEIMSDISPVKDMVEEKGRVDSAQGLQYLDEMSQRAMTNPTLGVEQAWSQAWRAMVHEAGGRLMLDPKPIPVTHMTTDLAGAVIDMESGTMSFPKNPIPSVGSLRFTVRETSPKSESARKSEALELVQMGLTDPMSVKMLALKEGLDFAMWMEGESSAYEQVVRNILAVYGDGVDPGQIIVTPYTCRPDIQIPVLQSFMGGPMMELASPQVVDAFAMYLQVLQGFMGPMLQGGEPSLDEAAQGEQRPPGEGGGGGQQGQASGGGAPQGPPQGVAPKGKAG